ncbi:MAG: exosortase family protein XrtF [Flavobacteriales bacterium]|nr:MAG: exosortase family protein XrtF [Flavobacteriales bacterium]
MASFVKNPLSRFLISGLVLFICWLVLYELWLHPEGKLDRIVIDHLAVVTSFVLKSMGYSMIADFPQEEEVRTLGIDGTHGVWIGAECNGLDLLALFIGFIIAYPGLLKRKLIYIPIGMLLIHVLNIIRITALCMITYHAPEYLDFNHTYTFTFLVYGFVFWLWYLWTIKFSGILFSQKKDSTDTRHALS